MMKFYTSTLSSFFLCTAAWSVACSSDDKPQAPSSEGSGGQDSADGGSEMGGATDAGGSESSSGSSSADGGEGSGGSEGSGGFGGAPVTGCDSVECDAPLVCDDSSGQARCACRDGFFGDDCTDINECADSTLCGPGVSCINTHGSYYCDCIEGTFFDQNTNECRSMSSCEEAPCAENAQCVELGSDYECTCNDGFFGNGWQCVAEDNCAADPCGANGTCVSHAGGYSCQCASGYSGSIDCASTCDVLQFPDPGLEAAVRAAVAIPSGDLLAIDLENHSFLNAVGFDVKNLEGLECWPHLQFLDLYDADLSEAGGALALLSLNQLQELYLGCTNIPSIEMLMDHPSLRRLGLGNASCPGGGPDLSVIGSLSALELLDVSSLDLDTLSEAADLRGIRYFFGSNNRFSDLSWLSSWGLLERVSLEDNLIDDASPFVDLKYLRTVGLENNQLTALEGFAAHQYLSTLNMGSNRLEEIGAMDGFESIKNLSVSDNSITDARAMGQLQSLTQLNLSSNQIESLEGMAGGPLRGTLDVRANGFSCEDEAKNIANLKLQGVETICDD